MQVELLYRGGPGRERIFTLNHHCRARALHSTGTYAQSGGRVEAAVLVDEASMTRHVPAVCIVSFADKSPGLDLSKDHRQGNTPVQDEGPSQEGRKI